jgi:hypothetical protein
MTLSHDQAEDTLRAIADAQGRSARAYGYELASPHLIMWGLLWAVGYGATAFSPRQASIIWVSVVAIGLGASFFIVLRRASGTVVGARLAPIALTAFAFTAAVIAVMAPRSGTQIGALIPLVLAAGYALLGIWRGSRFTIAGIIIAALTLGGFFLLRAHFNLWMAAVGGGSLVLAGFWLRKA